ncbi:MAG: DUF3014 domain-containing protein [Betaproteobacteria bacterium]|nr:DUF3014 domain-containing protein [Betaproteobacteria bacterium]
MGPIRIGLAIVATLGAAGAAWYFWLREPPPPPPLSAPVAQVQPAPVPPPPPEHYPVPEAAAPADAKTPEKPLAKLDESDKDMQAALGGLVGSGAFARFFNLEGLVRNIVVTVDNLPRKTFAMRLSPLKPVGGLIVVTGKDESMALAAENTARYAPWVGVVEKLDARKLVALYVRFHPLFQQAYVELGYPKGHFNTRLVQVIDHLLTAPEPAEPLRLTVPHVLHEFADPALEAESAGRKVLFRMGNANAAKVKAKLREIRRALVQAR